MKYKTTLTKQFLEQEYWDNMKSLPKIAKEVGEHRIDFLVEGEVILGIKAVEGLNNIYNAQVLTYLKAMSKRVGLLINFNVLRPKEGIKRLIM